MACACTCKSATPESRSAASRATIVRVLCAIERVYTVGDKQMRRVNVRGFAVCVAVVNGW
jgi:hypothetical protein